MKAYIVTSGDYSDYGIEAVFLDPHLANGFVILWNLFKPPAADKSRVEEYLIAHDESAFRLSRWGRDEAASGPHVR